jgi:hypothetical protein
LLFLSLAAGGGELLSQGKLDRALALVEKFDNNLRQLFSFVFLQEVGRARNSSMWLVLRPRHR